MYNPNISEATERFPILASGAITAKKAVVATTDDSNNAQRGKQADAVGQNATLSSLPLFLGVSPDDDISDATYGGLQRHGRCRALGGGAIVAGALVTFDANGKFTSYAHDATKFGMIAGVAASDCSGDNAYFDLMLGPCIIGPASAAADNFTLSGTLQAEQVTSTDDAAIAGLITVGEYIEQTEIADPAAPAANKCRLYIRDNGGKTELVARFPTGAIQQVAIEP